MKNEIKILVPELPESVYTAKIIKWHKKIGDNILRNDLLVDLETDKIVIEVPASNDGILNKIIKNTGDTVKSNEILGYFKDKIKKKKINIIEENIFSPSERRKKNLFKKKTLIKDEKLSFKNNFKNNNFKINENNLNLDLFLKKNNLKIKKIIDMSPLRKKISEKLVKSKNKTAMLTTFNEVNMNSILNIRKKWGEDFKNKYKVKLGLMSFFVKSVIIALKKYPIINTSIYKDKIIFYKNFNINIAISTKRGLIAPVLIKANKMSMSEIEKKIKSYINKANENKLTLQDLQEGTFTITNGGVFGSLISTPIINPPQTAILGIHVIKKRPIVSKKKITIAPMMYISLSYDHRLIDGKDSVGFLMNIKNTLENFIKVILDI
ncbi:2-oxo acid dehydrogenase subunit E2 [Buchnera aphidicola]|uniref:2-oxo acid dehydrogenase subunit E2 n=1 Tax=Buchnera aphidicola TaxID=9 RepID=UPI00209281CA|nr:2-oxo acid dehydrogenase subunit E2 [Buchnera aphidicola]USS94510.1 2-oxo acid dehydrogenase subunit E2 [Buchnera aphidicola (Periphyllus lyropictus)]